MRVKAKLTPFAVEALKPGWYRLTDPAGVELAEQAIYAERDR